MQYVKKKLYIFSVACFVFAATGCSTAPETYHYERESDEMKKGPGLFSGEEGSFKIYRKPAGSSEKKETD
jgi:hypothetical protein